MERSHCDVFCFSHFLRMLTIFDRGCLRGVISNRNNRIVCPKILSTLVSAGVRREDRALEVRIDSRDVFPKVACNYDAPTTMAEESVLDEKTIVGPW